MKIEGRVAEMEAVLHTAEQMCAAARTAPKTKGMDFIETCVLTEQDKDALAKEMERLAEELNYPFFVRDADCVRRSQAVVLIGVSGAQRGLNEGCAYCKHENCAVCAGEGGVCVYDPMDLGIALGSAVAVAADHRIDSRIMFSVGRAAMSLGIFGGRISMIMGIPVSASGKSPYFDRA